jgi:plastocyanin
MNLNIMRLLLLPLVLLTALGLGVDDTPTGRLHIVKMVDKSTAEWRFEPSELTVAPGDTVRWVQEDVVPHNVEFRETPDGAALGAASFGEFLLQKGATYELVIDDRFADGTYVYVCTPHDPMGMRATLKVAGSEYVETTR